MRARTFRVPFSRVAPEAVEIEWGPDDYLVVRPLLANSPATIASVYGRLSASENGTEDERRAALFDVLDTVVVEWSLRGEDGAPVARPTTWDQVNALPSGLASVLFDFLLTYRGDGPTDPTTAGTPS